MQITKLVSKFAGQISRLNSVADIDHLIHHINNHRAVELLAQVPSLLDEEPSEVAENHYDGDSAVLTHLWRVLFDRLCEENGIDPEGD